MPRDRRGACATLSPRMTDACFLAMASLLPLSTRLSIFSGRIPRDAWTFAVSCPFSCRFRIRAPGYKRRTMRRRWRIRQDGGGSARLLGDASSQTRQCESRSGAISLMNFPNAGMMYPFMVNTRVLEVLALGFSSNVHNAPHFVLLPPRPPSSTTLLLSFSLTTTTSTTAIS